MDFYERLSMRGVLWAHLHDLHGNAFQTFFHDLMALCVPGVVDVRTHGNLGDLASDGLDLHGGKLYACYAPETVDASATIQKFTSDLAGAIKKRSGQFTTFVFVHNDARGGIPRSPPLLLTRGGRTRVSLSRLWGCGTSVTCWAGRTVGTSRRC